MKKLIAIGLLTFVASLHAEPFVDPMRPASMQAKAHAGTPPLQVTAILSSDHRRIAIIDGEAVSEGDSIGGARIESIGTDQVRYLRAGRHETARLVLDTLPVRTAAKE